MKQNELSYLTEAFSALDLLDEEIFETTDDGISELVDFEEKSESDEDVIDVIDPEADSDEEVEEPTSYVGKIILDCCVCHSMLYKNRDEVVIDEVSGLANVDDECPFCYTSDGYSVIGEVAPYNPAEIQEDELSVEADAPVSVDVEDKEESSDELEEDLNNISLETDNEHITITAEPKDEVSDDIVSDETMIIPVDDETESDIMDSQNDDISNETPEEIPFEDDEDEFVDADDLDTDSFDEMEESYLKRTYSNVKSYKTTKVTESKDGKLVIEGVVSFKSGKSKAVKSIYESKYATRNGKVILEGIRTQSDEKGKTVRFVGRLNGKSIVTESLNLKKSNRKSRRG